MSTLYVDNLQPNLGNAVHAAGHVVQVVNKISNASGSTTSTSWTNSGVDDLNFSITPKFQNSKILMTVDLQLEMSGSNAGSFIFARDPAGTPVYFANSGVPSQLNPSNNANGLSKMFLSQGYTVNGQTFSHSGTDTPNTTSAVTYGILWGVNSGTAYFNQGTGGGRKMCSCITLMEIAQ
jgi:hypothetical protein